MENEPLVQPLPMQHRQRTFWLLLAIFVILLPFLFLYATGYRFEFGGSGTLVSTGGMYIAVERTGAEIYIDNELVRETRTFRRAFYAQSLSPGTHRVHVQKPGNHTWVKELPVYAHLVTEAQAFNLPSVPQVRIVSPWESATGTSIVSGFHLSASSTNEYIATSTKSTTTFSRNAEFVNLLDLFEDIATNTPETLVDRLTGQISTLRNATTSVLSITEAATTTIEWQGVKLYEDEGEVYARWVGSRENMPYYYCAEPFPAYMPQNLIGTGTVETNILKEQSALVDDSLETVEFIHPVQTVDDTVVCDPVIRMDNLSQEVRAFDFFNGTTDFVIMVLENGIYVVEIDDRAWQNAQPLLLGSDLEMRIENGQIYVYDGELIYQIIQA